MRVLKACSRCGRIHKKGEKCDIKYQKKYKNYSEMEENEREYKEFLSSTEWQLKRNEIKCRDLYLCSLCSENKEYNDRRAYDTQQLEVHHIIKAKVRPDLRLNNFNLITLCRVHHRQADAGIIKAQTLLDLAKKAEARRE